MTPCPAMRALHYHGDVDDMVLEEWGRAAYDRLAAGVQWASDYRVVQGMGHTVTGREVQGIIEFLSQGMQADS